MRSLTARTRFIRPLLCAAAASGMLALAACDDGPDSAGDAVDRAGEAVEDAADEVGDAIDDAADKVDGATRN